MDNDIFANEVLSMPWYRGFSGGPEQSALLILPGIQGYRIPEGVKYWPTAARYLWVAGTRADPFYTRKEITEIVRTVVGSDPPISYLENGGWANHTPDQMRWAVELLKGYSDVQHLIICTAEYHLPRCILCCVKTMQMHGVLRIISHAPICHKDGPVSGSMVWNEERAKILVYQKKGDIATAEEWAAYRLWRDRQK